MRSYSLSYLGHVICQARPTPAFPERRTKCSTTVPSFLETSSHHQHSCLQISLNTHTPSLSCLLTLSTTPFHSRQQLIASRFTAVLPCPAALTVASELRYRLIGSTTLNSFWPLLIPTNTVLSDSITQNHILGASLSISTPPTKQRRKLQAQHERRTSTRLTRTSRLGISEGTGTTSDSRLQATIGTDLVAEDTLEVY
jgi:hypothetical protein